METSFFLLTLIGILSSFVGTLAGGAGLITLPAMMLVSILFLLIGQILYKLI